jgi:hypothetical protein
VRHIGQVREQRGDLASWPQCGDTKCAVGGEAATERVGRRRTRPAARQQTDGNKESDERPSYFALKNES